MEDLVWLTNTELCETRILASTLDMDGFNIMRAGKKSYVYWQRLDCRPATAKEIAKAVKRNTAYIAWRESCDRQRTELSSKEPIGMPVECIYEPPAKRP